MASKVSARGQTVIPASIRKRYGITEKTRLEWIDDGSSITIVPVPEDPIEYARGLIKNVPLTEMLLASRREDREKEKG